MIFLIAFPSKCLDTVGRACAAATASSLVVSFGKSTVALSLPLTCASKHAVNSAASGNVDVNSVPAIYLYAA